MRSKVGSTPCLVTVTLVLFLRAAGGSTLPSPTRHSEYRSVLDRLRYTISSSLGDTDSSFGAEELLHRFQTLGLIRPPVGRSRDGDGTTADDTVVGEKIIVRSTYPLHRVKQGGEQALSDEGVSEVVVEATQVPNDESDNRLPGDDDVIKTALELFSEPEVPHEVEGSAHASSEQDQQSPVDDREERRRLKGRKSRRNRRRRKHNKDRGHRRSEKKSVKVRIGQSALYAVGSVVRLPLRKRDLRKDWCKAVSFDQEVSAPGCETKLVRNKFCYGQCSSFHIPRQHPGPFDSCASCTPTRTRSEKVVLNCHGNETKVRKVSIVEECACRPCGDKYF